MVNRRAPLGVSHGTPRTTEEQFNDFAAAADGGKGEGAEAVKALKPKHLNPHAKRNYKSIRLPFNEFEYARLDYFSEKSGRSKLSFIRLAIANLTKELERE